MHFNGDCISFVGTKTEKTNIMPGKVMRTE